MGQQASSRLMGDYYQHLYSWYEALQLLGEESSYEYAILEHPRIGSADDLTLHPKLEVKEAARFIQIKWHADHRSMYSFQNLAVSPKGEQPSLLQKLFASWRGLPRLGPIEVWLVSNWVADPHSLGNFLRDSHCLSEAFFNSSSRTESGKQRLAWRDALQPHDEKEFEIFCRDLRFSLGVSRLFLEKMVDDSMRGRGLRSGKDARDLIIATVADWIRLDRKPQKITRDLILEAIRQRGLKIAKVKEPKVCLWIHGWKKSTFNTPATVEHDWTRYFDYMEKKLPSQQVWERKLRPNLIASIQEVIRVSQEKLIDIRSILPMTYGLAVGSLFPKALGFTVRAEQPSGATNQLELWRSDADPSERQFVLTSIEETMWQNDAKEVLIVLGITADATATFIDLCRQKVFGPLSAVFIATPTGGSGQGALRGERDACALAIEAKNLLQRLQNQYLSKRIHLVPIAPAAFCLFLGQRLTGLGEILTYERAKDHRYKQSVSLITG